MDLTFTDSQRLLQESVERWTADVYAFEQRAAILASNDSFSRTLWKNFAELGWLALPLPEAVGGLGGSALDTGIVMEEFGKAIVLEPYLSTILLGAKLIALAGNDRQRGALLPGVIAGETLLSFAHSEKSTRIDPNAITTRALREGDGWALRGEKVMALGGASADQFIVSAFLGNGSDIGLFLIEPNSAGLAMTTFTMLDGQRASNLVLNDVPVADAMLLGGWRDARAIIDEVVDFAIVAASAAAAGSMQALLARTAEYLKTRVQFGEPLSTKQALRHRVADMALRCEEAKASALRAALTIDGGVTDNAHMLAASSAKVKVARAARFVGEQAVQLHGGMGVTEELDVGSYFRSLITFELSFGSADYHRRRYALLNEPQAVVAGRSRPAMHFSYTPEEEAFREEIRAFIVENLADDLRRAHSLTPTVFDDPDVILPWQRALNRRGWAAPGWPTEVGGPGWSSAQRLIFEQECARAHAPNLPSMGVRMVGPVLIRYGSQAQKDFYLPRILSGEDYWCQGYSEPGSGSDLASLKSRAVRDGDHYIINGTKIWTTHAHYANRMFALVRTSDGQRKQEGISFLLLDMDTPGITIRPILTIGGDHEVNQVFLDDVRVPVENLVGEEGAGWTYGKYLLEFERGGTSVAARLRQMLDDLAMLAARHDERGPASAANTFALRFAELEMDLSAFATMELRVLSIVQSGGSPGLLASYVKVLHSETRQEIMRLGVDILGERALTWEKGRPLYDLSHAAALDEDELPVMPNYLNGRATTIYGGSGEIQRDIIAKALLG